MPARAPGTQPPPPRRGGPSQGPIESPPATGAERHPNADLLGPLAHGEGHHSTPVRRL